MRSNRISGHIDMHASKISDLEDVAKRNAETFIEVKDMLNKIHSFIVGEFGAPGIAVRLYKVEKAVEAFTPKEIDKENPPFWDVVKSSAMDGIKKLITTVIVAGIVGACVLAYMSAKGKI